MTSDTKRLLLATVICMGLLMGWAQIQRKLYPPKPQAATTQPDAPVTVRPEPALASGSQPSIAPAATAASSQSAQPPGAVTIVDAPKVDPVSLGIDAPRNGPVKNPYLLYLRLNQRGAAIETAKVTDSRNTVARGRNPAPDNYDLMVPITDPETRRTFDSLPTRRLVLVNDKSEVDLGETIWSVEHAPDATGELARFSTAVLRGGRPVLQLTKTFHVAQNSRDVAMELAVENVSDTPESFTLSQSGPVGFRREDLRWDDRHAYNFMSDEKIKAHTRQEVWGQEDHTLIFSREGVSVVWSAVGNKYFGCIMAPNPIGAATSADFVRSADARALFTEDAKDLGDLTVGWVIAPPAPLAPKSRFACSFTVYMGPRSPSDMTSTLDQQYKFERIFAADRSPCTFEWLAIGIGKLFAFLHRILPGQHNYGFAIIILVFIVRALLHPLTKRGQTQTYKMQKVMQVFQPKLEALKVKYANDKQKLNAEMLELYRSEGVNPAAGSLLGCLPMLLQMPVWVALWSTLNSSIALRHEPFVPLQWWIPDLAAPDAVVGFGHGFKIPFLSDGMMIGPIVSLNILPILMGVTMWWQQKYSMKMSKPQNAPPPQPSPDGKPSMADQMAMQQKMMGYMTIFFSLMFYNFPSGLSVYILTSSLLAMAEQHHIRTQLKRLDEAGKLLPPPKPRGAAATAAAPRLPGWLEKIQKKAEEARQLKSDTGRR